MSAHRHKILVCFFRGTTNRSAVLDSFQPLLRGVQMFLSPAQVGDGPSWDRSCAVGENASSMEGLLSPAAPELLTCDFLFLSCFHSCP